MKLYRTTKGAFVEESDRFYLVSTLSSPDDWDELLCDPDLDGRARSAIRNGAPAGFDPATILAPVVSQEVWTAGVTYFSSRRARMEESKDAGGGDFYDRVYAAERPELFFKASGRRVVGHGKPVRIRSDAKWSVPEPELTLFVKRQVSSVYDGASALSKSLGNSAQQASTPLAGEPGKYSEAACRGLSRILDVCVGSRVI